MGSQGYPSASNLYCPKLLCNDSGSQPRHQSSVKHELLHESKTSITTIATIIMIATAAAVAATTTTTTIQTASLLLLLPSLPRLVL